MRLDQKLVDAAIAFIGTRFPGQMDRGAAAMYTENGDILLSTAIEVLNESVTLCHETGAICEAYAREQRITASACVWCDESGRFVILTACGVCQERLWFWGGDVEVAVPMAHDSTQWRAATLRDLSPHYWRKPFMM